jgi:hypothetical protein
MVKKKSPWSKWGENLELTLTHHNRARMRVDGCDREAPGTFDIHEEGARRGNEGLGLAQPRSAKGLGFCERALDYLELVFPGLGLRTRI